MFELPPFYSVLIINYTFECSNYLILCLRHVVHVACVTYELSEMLLIFVS
jgi:hypothetical protein